MVRTRKRVQVNCAPVLTLWAAVVAERLGFDEDEALSVGRGVANLEMYASGVALGVLEPVAGHIGEPYRARVRYSLSHHFDHVLATLPLLGTRAGVRALGQHRVIEPNRVRAYLRDRLGDALKEIRDAMRELAHSLPAKRLPWTAAELYERFAPQVPQGRLGWGACGVLEIDRIRDAAWCPCPMSSPRPSGPPRSFIAP